MRTESSTDIDSARVCESGRQPGRGDEREGDSCVSLGSSFGSQGRVRGKRPVSVESHLLRSYAFRLLARLPKKGPTSCPFSLPLDRLAFSKETDFLRVNSRLCDFLARAFPPKSRSAKVQNLRS